MKCRIWELFVHGVSKEKTFLSLCSKTRGSYSSCYTKFRQKRRWNMSLANWQCPRHSPTFMSVLWWALTLEEKSWTLFDARWIARHRGSARAKEFRCAHEIFFAWASVGSDTGISVLQSSGDKVLGIIAATRSLSVTHAARKTTWSSLTLAVTWWRGSHGKKLVTERRWSNLFLFYTKI